MAEKATVTRTVPAHTVTQTNIQWGNVIKGVAIVAAVVVVGVVAYGAASSFLMNTALGGQIMGVFSGIGELFMNYVWPVVEGVGSAIWGGISGLFNMAFPTVSEAAFAGEMGRNVASTGLIAGALGVTAGGAAAYFTGAHHHLADASQHLTVQETIRMPEQVVHEQVPLPATRAAETQGVNASYDNYNIVGAHHGNELAAKNSELASHASDHADDTLLANSSRRSQSWAQRNPQTSRRDVAPRQASHTQQIDAEQALTAAAQANR